MDEAREKFTIEIGEDRVGIVKSGDRRMHFSAGEALLLLDILKREEMKLIKMAEDASPLPIKINR